MEKMTRLFLCFGCALLIGCAQGQKRYSADINEVNQKLLKENEQRLSTLENSITALNTQVAQLNNRVYEVRTRTGQKTSMTVVPIMQSSPGQKSSAVPVTTDIPTSRESAGSTPASTAVTASATQSSPGKSSAPAGRKIDPAAAPAPLTAGVAQRAPAPKASAPKTAGKTASVGQPANVAGPSGQISVLPSDSEIALPPMDLPGQPAGQTAAAAQQVPVPSLNSVDLSLPPESVTEIIQPLPQVQTSQPQPAPRQQSRAGEEAAYNTALNAARNGRIPEAINLFRNFLQQYPNGKYRANADYWLGECLYSQGKLQDALSQFQNVNNAFPTHQKNADALLKAGMTLGKMGDSNAAREKYRQILSSFPNSDAARRVRAMGITP